MARRICKIVENNNSQKHNLRKLKENFRNNSYPEKVVEVGIQKALKIP